MKSGGNLRKIIDSMKGIILAGGKGTRLLPLTKITSKQLLPIYDRQMIFYPLNTLMKADIKDILIIAAPEYMDQFIGLLGTGEEFGISITYKIQPEPKGLAEAFIIGETFIGNDSVTLILGDNIFENDFSEAIQSFAGGGLIFAKEVPDPERFGVVELGEGGKVISIEEKPKMPKSNLAVTGLYVYDSRVVSFAKKLMPSVRGELEIVDLHNAYHRLGNLKVNLFTGIWEDAGTFDSLLRASELAKEKLAKDLLI
jgi:glucose-1-phosphate thymidylyltransferase